MKREERGRHTGIKKDDEKEEKYYERVKKEREKIRKRVGENDRKGEN